MIEALRDRLADDPLLALLLASFLLLAAGAVAAVYWFMVRPARRIGRTMQRFRADLAADLMKKMPATEMAFIDASVRLLVAELQAKEAELQRLYREATTRAESAEQRVTHVLESIESGVLAVSPAGRIDAANPAATRILGRAAVGEPLESVFEAAPALRACVASVLEGKADASSADSRLPPTESRPARFLSAAATALRDGSGNRIGCTVLFSDRTREKELEERVSLQEALAAIGELSAGLAHELRNPLAAIVGYATLLAKDAPEAAVAAPVRTILAEAQTLDRLVRDFLDFARPLSLDAAPVDLAVVVRKSIEATRAAAEAAGVVLAGPSPETHVTARADPARLQQALLNLLRNAVDASPRGAGISVTVAPLAPDEAEIRVRDRGPGVSPEHRPKLFTPFFSTKKTGVGMGLALVQKVAAAHGGRVRYEDADGGGAVFVLRLPVTPSVAGR